MHFLAEVVGRDADRPHVRSTTAAPDRPSKTFTRSPIVQLRPACAPFAGWRALIRVDTLLAGRFLLASATPALGGRGGPSSAG